MHSVVSASASFRYGRFSAKRARHSSSFKIAFTFFQRGIIHNVGGGATGDDVGDGVALGQGHPTLHGTGTGTDSETELFSYFGNPKNG